LTTEGSHNDSDKVVIRSKFSLNIMTQWGSHNDS